MLVEIIPRAKFHAKEPANRLDIAPDRPILYTQYAYRLGDLFSEMRRGD